VNSPLPATCPCHNCREFTITSNVSNFSPVVPNSTPRRRTLSHSALPALPSNPGGNIQLHQTTCSCINCRVGSSSSSHNSSSTHTSSNRSPVSGMMMPRPTFQLPSAGFFASFQFPSGLALPFALPRWVPWQAESNPLQGLDFPSTYEDLTELQERIGYVSRGLSDEQIAELPQASFRPTTSKDNKPSCIICISDFESGDITKSLPCMHLFHSKCIDQWLKVKGKCPTCQTVVET